MKKGISIKHPAKCRGGGYICFIQELHGSGKKWIPKQDDSDCFLYKLRPLPRKNAAMGLWIQLLPPKQIEMFICSLHFFFARKQKRPQGGIQVSSQILPCFHLQDFQAIFAALEECFGFHPDCEVTMEMDPGTFSGLETLKWDAVGEGGGKIQTAGHGEF